MKPTAVYCDRESLQLFIAPCDKDKRAVYICARAYNRPIKRVSLAEVKISTSPRTPRAPSANCVRRIAFIYIYFALDSLPRAFFRFARENNKNAISPPAGFSFSLSFACAFECAAAG